MIYEWENVYIESGISIDQPALTLHKRLCERETIINNYNNNCISDRKLQTTYKGLFILCNLRELLN